jgi:hypothetical protein
MSRPPSWPWSSPSSGALPTSRHVSSGTRPTPRSHLAANPCMSSGNRPAPAPGGDRAGSPGISATPGSWFYPEPRRARRIPPGRRLPLRASLAWRRPRAGPPPGRRSARDPARGHRVPPAPADPPEVWCHAPRPTASGRPTRRIRPAVAVFAQRSGRRLSPEQAPRPAAGRRPAGAGDLHRRRRQAPAADRRGVGPEHHVPVPVREQGAGLQFQAFGTDPGEG